MKFSNLSKVNGQNFVNKNNNLQKEDALFEKNKKLYFNSDYSFKNSFQKDDGNNNRSHKERNIL